MNPVAFFVLAALTVLSALTVIVHRNPVHSAVSLVATLCFLALFFFALDAQLVAILQVIVYAGAIVVLFLFVIMLLNVQAQSRATGGTLLVATASIGGFALAALIVAGLRRSEAGATAGVGEGFGETAAVARELFTVYLLPFELTSVLLLVAIVGAVALARKDA